MILPLKEVTSSGYSALSSFSYALTGSPAEIWLTFNSSVSLLSITYNQTRAYSISSSENSDKTSLFSLFYSLLSLFLLFFFLLLVYPVALLLIFYFILLLYLIFLQVMLLFTYL